MKLLGLLVISSLAFGQTGGNTGVVVGSTSSPSYINLFTANAGSIPLKINPQEALAKQINLTVEGFPNPNDPVRLNQVMRLGWNASPGGGLFDGTTPAMFTSWESHWCPPNDPDCYMEWHIEFIDSKSTIRRPISIQMDKNTPTVINLSFKYSNLTVFGPDGTQYLSWPIPATPGPSTMYFVGQTGIAFNTNNFRAIQQANAAGNAYIRLISADSGNIVQIADYNASGVNFAAPLQQTDFANNQALRWRDTNNTGRQILSLDRGNNLNFGNPAGGLIQINVSAGKEIRFQNSNYTNYMMEMFESTQDTSFGSNFDRNYKVAIEKSGTAGTLYAKDETPTTGFTRVLFDLGAADTQATTIFTVNGVMKFGGLNTVGTGSAQLGSNSPAINTSAPYTWIAVTTADGSTAYIPAWK